MTEDYSDRHSRGTQHLYDTYLGSQEHNHIEKADTFRSECSIYSINADSITKEKNVIWGDGNFGGIPVDYDKSNKLVYVDSSDSHTLVIGSTGSKKSRLLVMPLVRILGAADESMIVSDPKGEIYKRTADYLSTKGYRINVINLRNPRVGDSWNFLSIPYKKYVEGDLDKACEMINDAAVTLMPISSKDPYWDYSARDLFVGISLLLFKICKDNGLPSSIVNMKNLLEIRINMFLTSKTSNIKNSYYWTQAEQDDLIRTKLMGTVVCPENTMSCILSTFDQHVSCFSLQPQMVELLSSTTIDMDNIGYKKTAVFIITPDEKTIFHKIVTIFIKQIYEHLIDLVYSEDNESTYPIRINFVLDEFSSLPSIKDFPQMISAARSRNIRFFLIMQSKKQLIQRYKEESETIQSNCANWIFLFTRETELLKEINVLAGKKGNEDLISISKLQHLNKSQGECLVFSGRLYPYYSYLPDIDEYDSNEYCVLKMKNRNSESIPSLSINDVVKNAKKQELLELFNEENQLNSFDE